MTAANALQGTARPSARFVPRRLRDRFSFALQAVLTGMVVAWVLNVPQNLGFNLYTEQFLVAALGISLALAMLHMRARPTADTEAPTPWWDAAAGIAGLLCCAYIAVRYPDLVNEVVARPWDALLLSGIILVLVIETTRRSAGMTLVIVVGLLVLYALLGHLLPETFVSRPVQFTRLLVYLGLDTSSVLGAALNICLIVVLPFILMGQVLARCGGNEFFTDLAMATMGRYRGGAAKISVVGSSLFGMISGSAVSNVAAVGVITIPMMKRSGFRPHVAAAIEAVGSTGGQLAPPVMGAAAFLMAELLQMPYSAVMLAACIPALLYYVALFVQVDFEAAKNGIQGEPMDRLPALKEVLRKGWHFPIPFIVLVVSMLVFNAPAELAALEAAATLVVLNLVFGYGGKRTPLLDILKAVVETGRASIDMIVISAAAGIVIGILNLTGLAFGLTLQMLALSGDSLLVLLVLTAAVGVVLGMGMPTVGVYILLATLIAPALVKAGMSPMAAHMFVMYFGMMSMITPPVALAAFAAASIAQADASRTGWEATRIGWCSYLVPFMFAYSPALLMQGPVDQILWTLLMSVLGIVSGSAAIVGHFMHGLHRVERWLFAAAALMLLTPAQAFPGAFLTDVAGLLLFGGLTVRHWMRRGPIRLAPQAPGSAS
jgi:TRAP transporter 4TM/12TM fusion protein